MTRLLHLAPQKKHENLVDAANVKTNKRGARAIATTCPAVGAGSIVA
jgi:hypothetical protein